MVIKTNFVEIYVIMLYTKITTEDGGELVQIDEISKNGSIELEVKFNGRSMSFKSIVVEVKSNSVLISPIKANDQTVGFSDTCQINFLYKADNKLYLWENVFVKLVKYENNIYHKIDLNGEGKIYNRRNSFRLYIGEDMPLYVNTSSGPTAISVLVKDISETGVGFISSEELDIDRTIRLKLKENNNIISLSGVIVRKEFLPNLNSYIYGCKFNEKYPRLGKYIARRQAEQLRKKGMASSKPINMDKRAVN